MISNQLKELLWVHYPLKFPIDENNQSQISLFYNFLYDKRNSSLGDSLVNFIYSCAKTLAIRTFSSNKVPDNVLIGGFKASKLNSYLDLKGEKKKLGNYLESLFLLVWVFDLISFDELVLRLKEKLDPENVKTSLEEKKLAINAFTRIFNIIYNLISDV